MILILSWSGCASLSLSTHFINGKGLESLSASFYYVFSSGYMLKT